MKLPGFIKGFFDVQPVRIVRVKFLSWENEAMREKFFGSVDLYEQELQTGRVLPRTPRFLFYMKGTATRELTGVGTPPGSELEMCFNPEELSEERIRAYLSEIGLRVDDSSWRVLKDTRNRR